MPGTSPAPSPPARHRSNPDTLTRHTKLPQTIKPGTNAIQTTPANPKRKAAAAATASPYTSQLALELHLHAQLNLPRAVVQRAVTRRPYPKLRVVRQ